MQINSENNTKLIHRLGEYVAQKGISFNRLAVELGLSNSYFSKMVKSSGSVGSDVIEKILRMYPDLNPDWLLIGNDPMFRPGLEPVGLMSEEEMDRHDREVAAGKWSSSSENNKGVVVTIPKENQERMATAIPSDDGIPLIPLDAVAGFCNGNATQVMEYECER